jgi:hypothetical protein
MRDDVVSVIDFGRSRPLPGPAAYLDASGELRGPVAERIHGAIAALLRRAQALGCSPNPT